MNIFAWAGEFMVNELSDMVEDAKFEILGLNYPQPKLAPH